MNHIARPASSLDNLSSRVIRYHEMQPCTTAFIDARTPGSDKKENFCLIGGGVSENPGQIVHIDIPHGFNVGAARQPKGCKNSHHSHETEEVFMIYSGSWKFTWGEDGSAGEVVLSTGDTISIPTNLFRGFENVGNDDAFMFAILGLESDGTAGQVLWAPYVFEQAQTHGLVLLADGRLIDTAVGDIIPDGAELQQPTTQEEASALQNLSVAEMGRCVAKQEELTTLASGGLSFIDGVTEIAVIGSENSNENIGSGKMGWNHGFHMRRIQMQSNALVSDHIRQEEEVILVQSGEINITVDQETTQLNAGDLCTVPVGSVRSFSSPNANSDLIVIRRGDQPAAAQFC